MNKLFKMNSFVKLSTTELKSVVRASINESFPQYKEVKNFGVIEEIISLKPETYCYTVFENKPFNMTFSITDMNNIPGESNEEYDIKIP